MTEEPSKPRTGPLAHIPSPEELGEMNRIAKAFILSSLAYFTVGAFLGFAFAIGHPPEYPKYVFIHVHLLLVGWICFMIFGVGYKLIPTAFALKPRIWSFKLAWYQYWSAHAGVLGLALFWAAKINSPDNAAFNALFIAAAGVLFASIFLFALNILLTFNREVV